MSAYYFLILCYKRLHLYKVKKKYQISNVYLFVTKLNINQTSNSARMNSIEIKSKVRLDVWNSYYTSPNKVSISEGRKSKQNYFNFSCRDTLKVIFHTMSFLYMLHNSMTKIVTNSIHYYLAFYTSLKGIVVIIQVWKFSWKWRRNPAFYKILFWVKHNFK